MLGSNNFSAEKEASKKKKSQERTGYPVCILLLSSNKVTKRAWKDADDLVAAGKAKFISRTDYKAHLAGVKVPADIKNKGDRAVKDFILKQSKKPSSKEETKDTNEAAS